MSASPPFYSRVGITDLFGTAGRNFLTAALPQLPAHTADMLQQQLSAFDELGIRVQQIEEGFAKRSRPIPWSSDCRPRPASAKSSVR